MDSRNEKWFAVRCQPRKEDLAKIHLERQSFTCFLPKVRTWRRSRRETVPHIGPFFPGYLFVHLNLDKDRWRAIDGTIGVIQIVKLGSKPTPIPNEIMDSMLCAADETDILRFQETFEAGQHVRMVGGPFDNIRGIVEATTDSERVRILLDMMSRQVRISVATNELIPVR